MVGKLFVRGMLVGVIVVIFVFVFFKFYGELWVDYVIVIEE